MENGRVAPWEGKEGRAVGREGVDEKIFLSWRYMLGCMGVQWPSFASRRFDLPMKKANRLTARWINAPAIKIVNRLGRDGSHRIAMT